MKIIRNIKEQALFEGLSEIFYLDRVSNAKNFAVAVAERPYESWRGGARFGASIDPFCSDRWSWVYRTISRRILFYAGGDLYLLGMDNSINFSGFLNNLFKKPVITFSDEEEVIKESLRGLIWVPRPVISPGFYQGSTVDPSPFFNEVFETSLKRKIFIPPTLGEIVKIKKGGDFPYQ